MGSLDISSGISFVFFGLMLAVAARKAQAAFAARLHELSSTTNLLILLPILEITSSYLTMWQLVPHDHVLSLQLGHTDNLNTA